MKENFASQIKGIDTFLAEEKPKFNDWCISLFDNQLNLFSPQINTMSSETKYYDTEELCGTLELAYNELKKQHDDEQSKIKTNKFIKVDGNQKDMFRINFIKLLNVLPFELFIEKQRTSFRQNCFNSVMLEAIRDPDTYCKQQLPGRIDFTLWTERNQYDGCITAFDEVKGMNKLNDECIEDYDATECDPCTKITDSLFEKYRLFVQSNMLAVMSSVSENDLGFIEA